jgi:hypothetical protein
MPPEYHALNKTGIQAFGYRDNGISSQPALENNYFKKSI